MKGVWGGGGGGGRGYHINHIKYPRDFAFCEGGGGGGERYLEP